MPQSFISIFITLTFNILQHIFTLINIFQHCKNKKNEKSLQPIAIFIAKRFTFANTIMDIWQK